MMLNGRPVPTSRIGAMVKSDKKRWKPLSELRHSPGEVTIALNTYRRRWSKRESARSARKSRLFCGLSNVCKSEESSIEWAQVSEARNWKLLAKRRFKSRFNAW